MDQAQWDRLLSKRRNLSRLAEQIVHHEDLLKEAQKRSQSWEGASDSVVSALKALFAELSELLPEKNISFNGDNNLDGLRLLLSATLSKVRAGIDAISSSLDESPQVQMKATTSEASDKRRVFVVHGRNMKTKDAMFTSSGHQARSHRVGRGSAYDWLRIPFDWSIPRCCVFKRASCRDSDYRR